MMIGSEGSLDQLREWLVLSATARVIVLSMHEEAVHARRALAAGARAYVMKSEMIDQLDAALATVRSGGVWVSRKMSGALLRDVLAGQPIGDDPAIAALTDRQRAVLHVLLHGRSLADAADALAIALDVVEEDGRAICAGLGCASIDDLRARASDWLARLMP